MSDRGTPERGDALPPGQKKTDDWPVYHDGEIPRVDLDGWRLRAWGQVEQPVDWTWDAFAALPRKEIVADLHSLQGWSVVGRRWTGVAARELLGRVRLGPETCFVSVHGYGGYRANLPLSVFASADTLLAVGLDGSPLSPERGWPLRLVVPRRYLWKSVKWVRGLEFLNKDWPGTREMAGRTDDPDPWAKKA